MRNSKDASLSHPFILLASSLSRFPSLFLFLILLSPLPTTPHPLLSNLLPTQNNIIMGCYNEDNVSLKLCFGNEVRRVSALLSSYACLCELVIKLFEISIHPSQNLLFTYQDDTNETVTMVCHIILNIYLFVVNFQI